MTKLKILTVHPGATISTVDVYHGLTSALRARGHDIGEYRLDGRIAAAGAWLSYQRKRAKRLGRTFAYGPADVIYRASVDVLEKALRHQPDWVLIVSAMYLHPDTIIMLKRAGLRTALVLTESPYDEEKEAALLPFVDVAWTNERTCVPRLRRINPQVFYLPHAFDPERHQPGKRLGDDHLPAHDVVFVGTFFQERIDLLSAVNWGGIDLGLYGDMGQIPSRSRLRRLWTDGPQPNAVTAGLYRRAKIGLNIYRTSKGFGRHAPRITDAESLNPRALELAATGCFHLSDARAEVTETFGDLVPTFTNAHELEWLIRKSLEMSDWRRHVSEQLPAAVAGCTFAARAEQIEAQLCEAREMVPV